MKKNDLGVGKPGTGESFGVAFAIILGMLLLAAVVLGIIALYSYAPLFIVIVSSFLGTWVALAMALKYTPWGRWFMYGETDAKRAANKAAQAQAEQDKLNYPYGVRR